MYDSKTHFRSTYDNLKSEFSFQGNAISSLQEWQSVFRPEVEKAIRLKNIEHDMEDHVPAANHYQSEDTGSYVREKWTLLAEPTVPLPVYVLRPKNQNTPLPLVVTPHGHNHSSLYVGTTYTEEEQAHLIDGERDIAVQAVNEGYVAN